MFIIFLILFAPFLVAPASYGQGSFYFSSIQIEVNIASARIAHVSRAISVHFSGGNWTYMDWGLWYEGKKVDMTNTFDENGKLGFIYPAPGSDPTHPVLRILFPRPIIGEQTYKFTYQYDVVSDQDSFAWSETLDTSQVSVQSLSVVIKLPGGYQPTGLQPSDAKQSEENGRPIVSWTGTNLSGNPNVGLTIGFGQQTPASNFTFGDLPTYATIAAVLISLGLFGYSKMQGTRKRRRIEPAAVLEAKAREAATEAPREVAPSGLAVLDYLLNGGLPAGTATVLTSPACDERDAIIRKFLETGAKSGGSNIYLGKESAKVDDLLTFNTLGLSALLARTSEQELKQANVKVTEKLDNLSGINIDLMALLQAPRPEGGSKRLCIDVLDDLLLMHKGTMTRKWLSQLLSRVRVQGYTVLATLNTQMHSAADVQAIVDSFEGHIQLNESIIEGRPRIVLRVQKMSRWKFLDTEAVLDRNKIL